MYWLYSFPSELTCTFRKDRAVMSFVAVFLSRCRRNFQVEFSILDSVPDECLDWKPLDDSGVKTVNPLMTVEWKVSVVTPWRPLWLHIIYIELIYSRLLYQASLRHLKNFYHVDSILSLGSKLENVWEFLMPSTCAVVKPPFVFWRKEPDMADLDSYIFVPTQQSKRFLALSNVRSPPVLNVCEANVAWCRSLESCVFRFLILEI